MRPKRPILRYHGGKWKLAEWIISHFPAHDIYVEPFCGSASVLLRKDRARAEVINDRWDTIVNIFRILRDPDKARELRELVRLTPFARSEFNLASTERRRPATCCDLEAARLTLFRSYAGFGSASVNGDHSTGFRSYSKKDRASIPANDWANYPDAIDSFTTRISGVVIENREASSVIRQHDTEDTLFYVDPPYPHDTRNMRRGNAKYAFEMSDDDHRELAAQLKSLRGRVVISGYPCKLYDSELYAGWRRVERAHFADGARPRIEILWMNYEPQAGQMEMCI